MRKWVLMLFCLICFANLYAQQTVEMADVMRSNGKIYVVVGVIALLMAGIIVFLINLDRKISKLEKEVENDTKE
ncbi:MAG: CcmD family protein [Verrucomicrobia bacterium]|nr:CcmD family protein [Cytophagales bacterium]